MCVQEAQKLGERHEQSTVLHETSTLHAKGELCRRVQLNAAAAHLHHARGGDQLCLYTLESTEAFVKMSITFPTAGVPWLGSLA